MGRLIEWDGQPFAVLIEDPAGAWLQPPIVLDPAGELVDGYGSVELLTALVERGETIHHPIVAGADPARVAEVDQQLRRIAETLGVPTGPPDAEPGLSAPRASLNGRPARHPLGPASPVPGSPSPVARRRSTVDRRP